MMTWYFNNDGAADGPYDDEAMAALFEQNRIKAKTLVWHSGAEQWQEIVTLSPSWWRPASVQGSDGLPPDSGLRPTKAEAGTRGFIPKAPRAEVKTTEGAGFLRRLFGLGGKKK